MNFDLVDSFCSLFDRDWRDACWEYRSDFMHAVCKSGRILFDRELKMFFTDADLQEDQEDFKFMLEEGTLVSFNSNFMTLAVEKATLEIGGS